MKKLLLLVVAAVSLASAAKSELVLDTIGNTSSGQNYFGYGTQLGQSFVTSSGNWTLNDVVLRIRGNGTGIFVRIQENSSDLPGNVLATLSGPSSLSSGSFSNLTYTSTGLSLTDNTRYWIVLGSTDLEGDWSTTTFGPTTASWSIPGTGSNPSAIYQNTGGGPSWTGSNTIYNFSINATAAPAPAPVPEPGTWAAAALLAGGAAFARWRRRRESK